MTVETDQTYQEKVESDSNILCQQKKRDDQLDIFIILCQLKKGNYNQDIPSAEEVMNVYSYPSLQSIGFIPVFLMK